MTTGKTIALTRWTFVGKVLSLLYNMLSRLVKAFLPRGKCLFISWPQSPSAVILEPPKIKSLIVCIVSPSISHEVMYSPAIPLLGIHREETRIERDMCTPMFLAALFIIARIWKQPRCPSADQWIRKLWYIYTMEYYSALIKLYN